MLKNYLTIALRSIKKNKVYSLLNIFGLAIGMAVFILIFLYARYELSFDKWHQNADRVYRVVQKQPGNVYLDSDQFAVTCAPLAAALMQEYPEVSAATRIDNFGEIPFSHKEKQFSTTRNTIWSLPAFLKISPRTHTSLWILSFRLMPRKHFQTATSNLGEQFLLYLFSPPGRCEFRGSGRQTSCTP